jgi:hypothetical protein
MNIQEVAGAKAWSDLRKQMDLIKPKKSKQPTPPRKRLKGNGVERATARLSSAVAKLKPKSPIKPVQIARPSKANS